MNKVYVLIPARSGSKSVVDKNIRIMNNRPLLSYSIMQGLDSTMVDRVFVSTDSEKYAEIAKQYGAEAPFLRPAEYSTDTSLDIDVFRHFLEWLDGNDHEIPEILVHLRPTHPVRVPTDIDKMVELLIRHPEADSIRSVSPAKETPYKMWLFDGADTIRPLVTCGVPEAYNAPRQLLPEVYTQNACIDVIRTSTILEKNSMTGNCVMGYKMAINYDIDTEEDFLRAEHYLTLCELLKSKKRLQIVCDIDGVIAEKTEKNDYSKARPIEQNINILRALADCGHEIILHTARGYATGIDWEKLTKEQMNKWGVPCADVLFGKPNADFYIDDKMIRLDAIYEAIMVSDR